MHGLKPNLRVAGLLAVLAAAALLLLPSPRSASAVGTFSFEGVVCIEVDQGGFPQSTLILARIEPSATQPGGFDVTSVGYDGDTDGDQIADTNAGPPCNPPSDGNSLAPGVELDPPSKDRTPVVAKLVTKDSDKTLDWEGACTFRDDIGQWVLARFNVVVTGETTLTKNSGTLDVWLDPDACPTPPLPAPTLVLDLSAHVRTSAPTPGPPSGGLADDWDGDGTTDWDELALGSCSDPFNPADVVDLCPAVGGIAELAELDGTALETGGSSSPNTGLIAGLAGGATAAAVALAGAAWYARRRWVRVR